MWHMQNTKKRVLTKSDVKYSYSIITHFLVVQTLPHGILHSCPYLEINRLMATVNKKGYRNRVGAKSQTVAWKERRTLQKAYTLESEERRDEVITCSRVPEKWLRNTLSWTVRVSKKFPYLFLPKLFIEHHHGTKNSHVYPQRVRQLFFW